MSLHRTMAPQLKQKQNHNSLGYRLRNTLSMIWWVHISFYTSEALSYMAYLLKEAYVHLARKMDSYSSCPNLERRQVLAHTHVLDESTADNDF